MLATLTLTGSLVLCVATCESVPLQSGSPTFFLVFFWACIVDRDGHLISLRDAHLERRGQTPGGVGGDGDGVGGTNDVNTAIDRVVDTSRPMAFPTSWPWKSRKWTHPAPPR